MIGFPGLGLGEVCKLRAWTREPGFFSGSRFWDLATRRFYCRFRIQGSAVHKPKSLRHLDRLLVDRTEKTSQEEYAACSTQAELV